MKVYVAGSSAELERVQRVIAALRETGHEITLDWTRDVQAARNRGVSSDAELTHDESRVAGWTALEAVAVAGCVLFLAPETLSRGCWVELGAALAQRKDVYVAGPCARDSIFTALADRVFATDAEAVAFLG